MEDKIPGIKDAIEWANKRVSLKDLSQGFTPLQWEYLQMAFSEFVHRSKNAINLSEVDVLPNRSQITNYSDKELDAAMWMRNLANQVLEKEKEEMAELSKKNLKQLEIIGNLAKEVVTLKAEVERLNGIIELKDL